MKKPMALVPSLGLVMLGAAPVMAAGQTFAPVTGPAPVASAPSISNPSKIDTSDLSTIQFPEPPNFGTLSDEALQEVNGQGVVCAVAGAVFEIAVGAFIAYTAWATGSDPGNAVEAAVEAAAGSIISTGAGAVASAACAVL